MIIHYHSSHDIYDYSLQSKYNNSEHIALLKSPGLLAVCCGGVGGQARTLSSSEW